MTWTIPKKPRRKYYGRDGEKLPSVTEILGGLGWNREVLMGWANKIGRQGQTIHEVRNPKADAGSLAHHLIECDLTNVPYEETEEYCTADGNMQTLARWSLESWRNWWYGRRNEGWEVVEAELPMQDDDAGYAGTVDLILRDPCGELVVADIKTGSPHAEAVIQMAGYADLYEATRGETPHFGLLLHVPTDGRHLTPHTIPRSLLVAGHEVFAQLLFISRHKKAFADFGKVLRENTPAVKPVEGKHPF